MAELTKERLRQELEWRRCKKDPVYFFENYWFIKVPGKGRKLFSMRQAQKDGLAHWMENRYSLTLKARQIGWTTLASAYQFWFTWFHDDRMVIDISKSEREAHNILKKTKYGYKGLPEWMKAKGPKVTNDTLEEMSFTNHSSIVSRPSAADPARGESADLIIVDEWAFLPNPEEAWASIEPVADVGGRIIGLSTANGWGEFFHTMWVGARNGTNEFKAFFAPWSANEDRDAKWYETKKRAMSATPWTLAQEYPSNEVEAFRKSGRLVFDLDRLQGLETEAPTRGDLHSQELKFVPATSLEDESPLAVWSFPELGGVYVIGADVAEGLEHGDYSSAHVIDVRTGLVAAHWHGHIDPDLFGELVLARLGYWYNDALIIPEANNHGLTTVVALRRKNYPRLYRRLNHNTSKNPVGVQFGWMTNVATKPRMIDDLVQAIRDEAIDLRCEHTIAELMSYVREANGTKMHGSPYDDRVMSLALAVQGIALAYTPEYAPKRDDYMSFDWWLTQRAAERESGEEWRIGAHNVRRSA